MPPSESRDIDIGSGLSALGREQGRNLIAVIGLGRYRHWPPLPNAVSDALGAAALFDRLGFTQVIDPLIDDGATGNAMQSLVTDELVNLGHEDSLVLFYAGHGGNRKHRVGGRDVTTGYLIPVDAEDKVATWINLEAWLHAVALLPPKHILVVLDACHSGIALDPAIRWRDATSARREPLSTLRERQSRRIITSALNDQRAMDGGPYPGHSLFTGCLMEGLTHGLRRDDRPVTTGSELGLYVQRRVREYPHSQQTPDFGAFAFDDRGELVIPLLDEQVIASRPNTATAGILFAWLDLIDLDDIPGSASDDSVLPGGAASATESDADDDVSAIAGSIPTLSGSGHGRELAGYTELREIDELGDVDAIPRARAEAQTTVGEPPANLAATALENAEAEAQAATDTETPAEANGEALAWVSATERETKAPREGRGWQLEEQARIEFSAARAELAARGEEGERERQQSGSSTDDGAPSGDAAPATESDADDDVSAIAEPIPTSSGSGQKAGLISYTALRETDEQTTFVGVRPNPDTTAVVEMEAGIAPSHIDAQLESGGSLVDVPETRILEQRPAIDEDLYQKWLNRGKVQQYADPSILVGRSGYLFLTTIIMLIIIAVYAGLVMLMKY